MTDRPRSGSEPFPEFQFTSRTQRACPGYERSAQWLLTGRPSIKTRGTNFAELRSRCHNSREEGKRAPLLYHRTDFLSPSPFILLAGPYQYQLLGWELGISFWSDVKHSVLISG